MIVFAHTVFALPFAIIGFFLAVQYHGHPFHFTKFLLVLLCMVFARSAAMAFNRWADRRFDKLNPRTAQREIPAGIISEKNALIFVVVNSVAFIVASGLLNTLCLILSPLALTIVLGYSYAKRFTRWCHLILGLGLSLAPTGAYLAVSGEFDWLPVVFSLVVITWVGGFDIIYSLQDADFDRKLQLKSVPAGFGVRNALKISWILHTLTIIFLVTAGWLGEFAWFFVTGATIFIFLLFYQHHLVKENDLSKINRAFGTTNGIASVVFAIFVLLDLFFR